MKVILHVSLLTLCAATALALPSYDQVRDATGDSGTDYAVGAMLAGQRQTASTTSDAWFLGNNSATVSNAFIASGNLTYPGLAITANANDRRIKLSNPTATFGAAARWHPTGIDAVLSTAATRFFSFVLKVEDLTGMDTAATGTANFIAGFNNTAGSSTGYAGVNGAGVRLKNISGTGYQVGFNKSQSATPSFYTGQTFTTSDTVLIVGKYEIVASGTANDICTWWVNPSAATFGDSPPTETFTTAAGTDLATSGSLFSFLFACGSSIGTTIYVDEVRVGSTWADVTPAGPPTIITQPANLTKNFGESAVLSVAAVGHGTLTYQWKKFDGASTYTNIPGEVAASYTNANVNQASEGTYQVTVTNDKGSTDSATATLTVNDPAVTSGPSPASQSLPPGATAVISCTATGTPALSYRWKKDGSDVVDGTFGGATISGATTATLTIAGVRAGGAGDAGSYTLSVTNSNGRGTTSSASTLIVIDPAITVQPQSQAKNYNDFVTLTVTVAGSSPPFSYSWKKDGSAVTVDGVHVTQNNSGNSSSLTISNLAFSDRATSPGYSVVVTDNASQSTTSSNATLTVVDPRITTQVANVLTNAGSTAILKVQAAGSGVLAYAWKTNGVAVADGLTSWGSTISGATSDTLSIANVTATDAKTYTVDVSGSGPTQSSTGTLSVVTITRQPTPSSLAIATGGKAVFSAAASVAGTGTLTYQWRKTSGDIAGETSTAIALTNAQPSDSDSYSLKVTYGTGSSFIQSASASLTVSSSLQLSNANLVVARIGDGAQTLRDAGNSIYLDQFTTSGTYVNTVTIPDTGSDSIIARGTAGDTIGALSGMTTLTLSDGGGFLVLNGFRTNYDASANIILGSANDPNLRAVSTVSPSAQYALRVTAATNAIGISAFRCAAFDGVDEFWGATGSTTIGAYYFGTQVSPGAITFNNARIVSRFNGKFYLCGANAGIFHFDGKPHPGDTLVQDITVSTAGGSGACDFAVSPDGNTIYIADGRAWSATVNTNIGGVQKWEKTGGSFGTIPTRILKPDPDSTVGALYVTVDFSGANPVAYATTIGASQNKLVKIVDDGSNSGAGTATLLATAGPSQQFRGIRFGPGTVIQPPQINSIERLSDGNVRLSVTGTAGTTYSIEASGTLTPPSWSGLTTNSNPTGTFTYDDLTATNSVQRYYRGVHYAP